MWWTDQEKKNIKKEKRKLKKDIRRISYTPYTFIDFLDGLFRFVFNLIGLTFEYVWFPALILIFILLFGRV